MDALNISSQNVFLNSMCVKILPETENTRGVQVSLCRPVLPHEVYEVPVRTSLWRWGDSLKGFQVRLNILELTENVAINLHPCRIPNELYIRSKRCQSIISVICTLPCFSWHYPLIGEPNWQTSFMQEWW